MPGLKTGSGSGQLFRNAFFFFFLFRFEPICHSIPAQILPSVRCPAVHDQLPFHSSIAFFFVFKPLSFIGHAACGILIPWPGIEPMVPAVAALSRNHWTTREVSSIAFCLQRLSETFHLLPYIIFVFIHCFNRHLLLNQSPCGRCFRGQKEETWPSLFIYLLFQWQHTSRQGPYLIHFLVIVFLFFYHL